MGAKDWMVVYAEGEVRPVLQAGPALDREATLALVQRLHPGQAVTALGDCSLAQGNPPDGVVHAGCFPGLAVVCTGEVALDEPSRLHPRFLAEGHGRTTYLHAMHSVVDWCALAVWAPDGVLVRAQSLSPDDGIIENTRAPLPFEEPDWAGERAVDEDEDDDEDEDEDEEPYPLPFHPLELASDALRHFLGFEYEGMQLPDDPDPEQVPLVAYRVGPAAAPASGTAGARRGVGSLLSGRLASLLRRASRRPRS